MTADVKASTRFYLYGAAQPPTWAAAVQSPQVDVLGQAGLVSPLVHILRSDTTGRKYLQVDGNATTPLIGGRMVLQRYVGGRARTVSTQRVDDTGEFAGQFYIAVPPRPGLYQLFYASPKPAVVMSSAPLKFRVGRGVTILSSPPTPPVN